LIVDVRIVVCGRRLRRNLHHDLDVGDARRSSGEVRPLHDQGTVESLVAGVDELTLRECKAFH
jgi:hypothetical protein